jgi:hypothetical protein
MQKYDYVFKHDRAGRLLDVQTFENLELDECCFTQRLLEEIRSEAQQAASRVNGHVVLHHAYVERRVTPLDVYLETAEIAEAEAAVIDFGRAIKDLARTNVFPGDMLIKNFGVTALGRVVFYDYDELGPLTNFNFRKIPRSRHYDDEMSAEPWYSVGDHDVFPEEFASFLGLSPDLRHIFPGPPWRPARPRILETAATAHPDGHLVPHQALRPPPEATATTAAQRRLVDIANQSLTIWCISRADTAIDSRHPFPIPQHQLWRTI